MTDEQTSPPIPERLLLRGERVWLRPTVLMAILREEWKARRGSGA